MVRLTMYESYFNYRIVVPFGRASACLVNAICTLDDPLEVWFPFPMRREGERAWVNSKPHCTLLLKEGRVGPGVCGVIINNRLQP